MPVTFWSMWDTERNDAALGLAAGTASDHPLDLTERGLAMKATRDQCVRHEAREGKYQHAAALRLFVDRGTTVQPWYWISSTCDEPFCLNAEHLIMRAPLRLDYPYGVCIYCGRSGWVKDHLLPRPQTGDAHRRYVITVPACGQCNCIISDFSSANITERRAVAHRGIRRRHAKQLATREHTREELAEFGPRLRKWVIEAMARKAEVVARLEWPIDQAFDLRAAQSAGIDDPYATGLLSAPGAAA